MVPSVRQVARQQALEVQRRKRAERRAAEKRRTALAVEVAVALGERDASAVRHELVAARSLRTLVRSESVRLQDIEDWVPDLTTAEARRLLSLEEPAGS